MNVKGGYLIFEKMRIRNFLLSGTLFLVTLIIFTMIFFKKDISSNELVSMVIFPYGLLGVFPFIWFFYQFKRQNVGVPHVIQTKGIIREIPRILVIVPLLIIFSIGIFWLTQYILNFVSPEYVTKSLSEDIPFPKNKVIFFLMLINASIIGPIAEEFIFRGLLLNRITYKTNLIIGITLTNVLFGFFHADLLGSFVFGLIMSLLYLKSNNILLPIICHILNNSIASFMAIFFPNSLSLFEVSTIADIHSNMTPNIVLLLITSPLICLYIIRNYHLITKNKVNQKRNTSIHPQN
ncbi:MULTISPECIES: CPBP family intramembrane glutamic endopeptidase [Bacillus cereus group]|nr:MULTISPECIES: type II CAAX endopeptidase family protein [Bacillus cereus group]OHX28537.1 hypothetical protein BWGOE5_55660 [Bacillus mycoides]